MRAVRFAPNFRRNLDEISHWLAGRDRSEVFERLLDQLAQRIVPFLQKFPDTGRDLLAQTPRTHDARTLVARIEHLCRGQAMSLRQVVAGEYVVLYSSTADAVTLLAIKHFRQLAYDLAGLDD